MSNTAKINDVVALLQSQAESKLSRGLVGTVVEELDAENILVEFIDENGQTYAITPVPVSNTLVLHYQNEAT
jgi:hypothetical protein